MKKKIFIFLNGVAYPTYYGYRVRIGQKWHIDDSCNIENHWQLVKMCRVNIFRYPFIQFDKETHEMVIVAEKVGNESHVREFIEAENIFITRT